MPSSSLQTIPIRIDTGQPESIIETSIFACVICSLEGREEYPDASDYVGPDKKPLREARLAPNGEWVCSQACLSQLMFQTAMPLQRELLKRYELALRDLDETRMEVGDLLKAWDCNAPIKQFDIDRGRTQLGISGRRLICGQPTDSPAWIQGNELPEDMLREGIQRAIFRLECRVQPELTMQIDFQHRMADLGNQQVDDGRRRAARGCDFVTKHAGRVLGTIGGIITALKAALAGEVAE